MSKPLIEEKFDIIASCESKNICQEIFDLKEKNKEIKENETKLKLEIIEKNLQNKQLERSLNDLIGFTSNYFLFSPIENFLKDKLKVFPETLLFAMGELDNKAIDIWILLDSDDIKIRRAIAKIQVEIRKIWNYIPFEFMVIPGVTPENLDYYENEYLSKMVNYKLK